MGDALIIQSLIPEENDLESIKRSLFLIQQELLKELSFKQNIVEAKDKEIEQLKAAVSTKENLLEELRHKLYELEKNAEGNKQLNQKLINELLRKQQDIEWYNRTYERRSILGRIKALLSNF